jgi:hypothetical protein
LSALRGAVLSLVSITAAAQQRAAVVEVRPEDGAGPEVAAAIASELTTRLGPGTLGPAELTARLRTRRELRGCTSAPCLDKTAALAGAQRLVGGTVRRDGSSLRLDVWVYDPAAHASVTGKSSCTGCPPKDLAAAALREALDRDQKRFVPATIVLSSQPTGATVRLDGKASGLTPVRLRVPAGSHGLVIAKEGFVGQTRDFDAEGSETLDLHFNLQPEPRPGPWPGYKWLALGGAIVAASLGGVLIAIDGDEVGFSERTVGDDRILERETRDTKTVGIVSLGVGVALGATSGTLWWSE